MIAVVRAPRRRTSFGVTVDDRKFAGEAWTPYCSFVDWSSRFEPLDNNLSYQPCIRLKIAGKRNTAIPTRENDVKIFEKSQKDAQKSEKTESSSTV
jgi:hypothetical protein